MTKKIFYITLIFILISYSETSNNPDNKKQNPEHPMIMKIIHPEMMPQDLPHLFLKQILEILNLIIRIL
ncbi:MAG: hypothetical protein JXK07_01750 [Spirochaetes bacterium]|nr:hypothetical protein [Spirochaetota bacterium]MBN2772298.1 hypothetical protein [Spirochaetota bacterium]